LEKPVITGPDVPIQMLAPPVEHADRSKSPHGECNGDQGVDDTEMLLTQAYDDGVVTEVIRPAAVVPEQSARHVLVELAMHDVRMGGVWWSEPTNWRRYDMPWNALDGGPGTAELMGTMQICYGVPTRFDITIFRATITRAGMDGGMTVTALCDEALAFGGLSLATCPRADLKPPPRPFPNGS
jgi:hypothetical protein